MGLLAKADKTGQDAKQLAVRQSELNTNSCAKGNRQGPKAKAVAIQHGIKAYQNTYWDQRKGK